MTVNVKSPILPDFSTISAPVKSCLFSRLLTSRYKLPAISLPFCSLVKTQSICDTLPAGEMFFFNQVYKTIHIGQFDGSPHSGNPGTDHQYRFLAAISTGVRDSAQHGLGNSRFYQFYGLPGCILPVYQNVPRNPVPGYWPGHNCNCSVRPFQLLNGKLTDEASANRLAITTPSSSLLLISSTISFW